MAQTTTTGTTSSELARKRVGGFWWGDLITTDVTAAKRFYSELLGWTFEDVAGFDTTYTMCLVDGKRVFGMYAKPAGNVPPSWMSYLFVDDADAATAKARSLGATVLSEPFDVMDTGRSSIIADPTGAVLVLWQSLSHPGAALTNEPGSLAWNELMTSDVKAAIEFYTALAGWTTEPMGDQYTVFKSGTEAHGGTMAITPEMGDVPPHWLTYIKVADLDATLTRTTELGGRVLKGATPIEGWGSFAVLADPQGAVFAVLQGR